MTYKYIYVRIYHTIYQICRLPFANYDVHSIHATTTADKLHTYIDWSIWSSFRATITSTTRRQHQPEIPIIFHFYARRCIVLGLLFVITGDGGYTTTGGVDVASAVFPGLWFQYFRCYCYYIHIDIVWGSYCGCSAIVAVATVIIHLAIWSFPSSTPSPSHWPCAASHPHPDVLTTGVTHFI